MAQELNLNVQHITCWSSSLNATHFGNHIYSIEITEDMDNGLLVSRDTYVGDQVWKMKKYAAGQEPLLLLNPPVVPFTAVSGYATEDKFYNAKGEGAVRAYTLDMGDRYALTVNAFDKEPTVGKFVTFDATDKLYKVVDRADDTQFCAQVLSKIVRSNMVMYKIQVVHL